MRKDPLEEIRVDSRDWWKSVEWNHPNFDVKSVLRPLVKVWDDRIQGWTQPLNGSPIPRPISDYDEEDEDSASQQRSGHTGQWTWRRGTWRWRTCEGRPRGATVAALEPLLLAARVF
ncbi:hypothetical protein Gotur_011486 [Gossypium turneri]